MSSNSPNVPKRLGMKVSKLTRTRVAAPGGRGVGRSTARATRSGNPAYVAGCAATTVSPIRTSGISIHPGSNSSSGYTNGRVGSLPSASGAAKRLGNSNSTIGRTGYTLRFTNVVSTVPRICGALNDTEPLIRYAGNSPAWTRVPNAAHPATRHKIRRHHRIAPVYRKKLTRNRQGARGEATPYANSFAISPGRLLN